MARHKNDCANNLECGQTASWVFVKKFYHVTIMLDRNAPTSRTVLFKSNEKEKEVQIMGQKWWEHVLNNPANDDKFH